MSFFGPILKIRHDIKNSDFKLQESCTLIVKSNNSTIDFYKKNWSTKYFVLKIAQNIVKGDI